MRILNTAIIAVAILLFACEQEPQEVVTESGLAYTMYVDEPGEPIDSLDIVTFNYTILNGMDSMVDNSYKTDEGVRVQVGRTPGIDALQEGLMLMNEGDSMKMRILSDKLFPQRMPPGISEGEKVSVLLKVEKVQSEEEFKLAVEEEQKAAVAKEGAEIEKYLEEKGVEAQKTESGLYYVVTKEGTGEMPQAGETVQVHYKGMLMDGTIFDSSMEKVAKENGTYVEGKEYNPFSFVLGQGMVIRGWDEGIAQLKEGAEATLYIPSSLGYGPRGAGGGRIPPNATLIFDVQLVEIGQ